MEEAVDLSSDRLLMNEHRGIRLVYVKHKNKSLSENIKLLFWISLAWSVGEQDKKLTLSTNYTKTVIVLWDRWINMGKRGVGSSTTRFVCFSQTIT
jgi:hypothetical protein